MCKTIRMVHGSDKPPPMCAWYCARCVQLRNSTILLFLVSRQSCFACLATELGDRHHVKNKECFASRFTRRMNDAKVDDLFSDMALGTLNSSRRPKQQFCQTMRPFLDGAHCDCFIKIEHHRRKCIAKSKLKY